MKIIKCEQRSPEWYKVRCGVPTSSNFHKIITPEGKPSKQSIKYLHKVAGEYVSGVQEESYQNENMLRGIEMEEEAKKFYEVVEGIIVEQVGFVFGNPENEYGCSPDGFVGDKGMVEIKCPIISTHVGYLLNNEYPKEYFQQTQGQLLVTGRRWIDFLSYYPGLKPLIIRVTRDEDFLKKLRGELNTFCQKLREVINIITSEKDVKKNKKIKMWD